VVIDAVVNADIPTVPPTLEPKQAKQLARALAEDPDAARVREQMKRQEIHSEDGEMKSAPRRRSSSAAAKRGRATRTHRS
jgi:hypothetical protein